MRVNVERSAGCTGFGSSQQRDVARSRRRAGAPRSPRRPAKFQIVCRPSEVLRVLGVGRRPRRSPRAWLATLPCSAALGDEPAAGPQRRVQAREERVVVEDPVEGRGREDQVDRLVELQLEQVGDEIVGPVAERLARLLDHRLGAVDARSPGPRAGARPAASRDPARAAAGVEHVSSPRSSSRSSTSSAPLELRVGDPVVGLGVPLAGPGVHRIAGRSQRRSSPGPRRPRRRPRSRRSRRAFSSVIADVVEAVEQPVLDVLSISNSKTPAAQLTVSSSTSIRASPASATARQCSSSRIDRQQPDLGAVGVEDVGEGRRDDRLEAEVLQRPGGVLARGAAAEVAARRPGSGSAPARSRRRGSSRRRGTRRSRSARPASGTAWG